MNHRPDDEAGRVFYDDLWASTWGAMQAQGPVHRHTAARLLRDVAALRVGSVLDVGCGSGENLAALSAIPGLTLMGADYSPRALEIAGQRVPMAQLFELDVEAAALDGLRADLVTSLQVVEHLTDDQSALRNMATMSRRWVMVATMSGKMRPSESAIGHLRNYSADELRHKLTAAGLEVCWIRRWGFPWYSPVYRSLVEHLPSGPPSGEVRGAAAVAARMLYQLYRLNLPNRGDVITALARHPDATAAQTRNG